MKIINFELPDYAQKVFDKLCKVCTPYIVGGWIRDNYLGLESNDIEIECFGKDLDIDKIISCIEGLGKVNEVGKHFSVININIKGNTVEISLPRRDVSTGSGSNDFVSEPDGTMKLSEAAQRRDLTVNALYYNPTLNVLEDPTGGLEDADNGIARMVSPDTFPEDPVRPLRAFRFISRFGFEPDKKLIETCSLMSSANDFDNLPNERVWKEIEKWALQAKDSSGLRFLLQTGWGEFLQLDAMNQCEQDSKYHPEGNVFEHTCHVVDSAIHIANRENLCNNDRLVLILSALLHDIGKIKTTVFEDNRWKSPGHANESAKIAEKILAIEGCPADIKDRVTELCKVHMQYMDNVTMRTVRRFLHNTFKLNSLEMFEYIAEADKSGRPPLPKGIPEDCLKMTSMCREFLANQKPEKLIKGRHLIEKGWKPGIEMGKEIKRLYELQIEEGLELEELLGLIKK